MLIECNNVSFSYENYRIIKELSFKVNQGDYLVIIGENGTGKTTLIKGLLGLKQPSKGRINYNKELTPKSIGYLPQQILIKKDFPASVFEIVLSGSLNSKKGKYFYNKKDKEDTLNKLEQLNISHLKNKSFKELSGGQQQRVLLARALLAAKNILLLDEPTASLDPVGALEFYQLINKMNKEQAITIIMVSHDQQQALKYASHILHLKENNYIFEINNKRNGDQIND